MPRFNSLRYLTPRVPYVDRGWLWAHIRQCYRFSCWKCESTGMNLILIRAPGPRLRERGQVAPRWAGGGFLPPLGRTGRSVFLLLLQFLQTFLSEVSVLAAHFMGRLCSGDINLGIFRGFIAWGRGGGER